MLGRVFLGRYQTLRLLGEGGMGRVYLARQLDLGRQVVVKVMHDHLATDSKFCERFQHETLLMARFQHPYAVTLYDASLNDPQGPCIVMEYIKGVTLDVLRLNNKGRLSVGRVGRLLNQLCEVLQAAHTAGIIHRDLKPANLMVVDPDTPYEKIKVMDFGLAKLLDSPQGNDGHASGQEFAVGTPHYICPEQVRGEAFDRRSDIYSVGVILYELLTGRTPFGVDSTMDLLLAHATEEPHPFGRPDAPSPVSPAVEQVVLSCLAKDAHDRPASARELAERFGAALAATAPETPVAGPVYSTEPDPDANNVGLVETESPDGILYRLEAWMPETIALHKLQGFIYDVGGELVDSTAGRVRMRLGGPSGTYHFAGSQVKWFGRSRRCGMIELDLRMYHSDPERPNRLSILVAVKPLDFHSPFDAAWREYTAQVFCDLRGYLMGHTEPIQTS
jgi:serine/threonine-protein kinase